MKTRGYICCLFCNLGAKNCEPHPTNIIGEKKSGFWFAYLYIILSIIHVNKIITCLKIVNSGINIFKTRVYFLSVP